MKIPDRDETTGLLSAFGLRTALAALSGTSPVNGPDGEVIDPNGATGLDPNPNSVDLDEMAVSIRDFYRFKDLVESVVGTLHSALEDVQKNIGLALCLK